MNTESDFFKVNKATWNEKAKVHSKSEFYDLEAFKKGKSSLMPYELETLGDFLSELDIVQAQPRGVGLEITWFSISALNATDI